MTNQHKRKLDDWYNRGVCFRHKYINGFFKTIWRAIVTIWMWLTYAGAFLLAVVAYKFLFNPANQKEIHEN